MSASVLDLVQGALSENAVKRLGQSIGADEKTTASALSAALPMLVGALSRNASSATGADALASALDRGHDGSILDDPSTLIDKAGSAPGQGILRHILGSKQARVEQGIGQFSGLDAGSSGKLLSLLAPIVLGALGKAKRDGGMGVGELVSSLSSEREKIERNSTTSGLIGNLLDADGDGDVDLGDILKKGPNLLGKLFD